MRNTAKPLAAAISLICCLLLSSLASPAAAAPSSTALNAKSLANKHLRHHRRGHPSRRAVRQREHQRRVVRERAARERAVRERTRERTTTRTRTRERKQQEATSQAAAAAIATVLATPCQNTEITPEPGNLEVVTAAVLCLINRERAEHNELPLALNNDLQGAAQGHDDEMIEVDYFAHISPSGITPVDRIRQKGYIPSASDGYVLGENLAWGTYDLSTPASIVQAWIASPGHLANILETQYTETGIAIVPNVPESLGQGAPGATYAQEFGVIIH